MTTSLLPFRFASLCRLTLSTTRTSFPRFLTSNSILSHHHHHAISFPQISYNRAFVTNTTTSPPKPPPPKQPSKPQNEPDYIVDINGLNFHSKVVQSPLPTILLFYVDGHPATNTLTNILEEFANQKKSFRLAKINVDINPDIAEVLGIRNVPALISANNGQKIADFTGGGMDKLKEFIENTILLGQSFVDKVKTINDQGNSLLESGDIAGATAAFNQLIEDKSLKSEHLGVAGLARCALKEGNLVLAQDLVNVLREKHTSSLDKNEVRQAISQVELAIVGGTSKNANIEELKKKKSANPDDMQSRYELAEAYLAQGQYEAAAEECLEMIKKDKRWNEEAARKLLLKIFEVAGLSSPLTASARKRLSKLWFL